MHKRILETVKQAIMLSMFADRINVPYSLYSFTTDRVKHGADRESIYLGNEPAPVKYDIVNWAVGMIELSSSDMHKTKNARMMKRAMFNAWLIDTRNQHFVEDYFHLGGTPLIETAAFATIMVKEFIAKKKIQKMNTIFLTDGSAQDLRGSGQGGYIGWDTKTVTLSIEGEKLIETDTSGYGSQDLILKSVFKNLRKYSNLVGFFLTSRNRMVNRKDGFATCKDYNGYDSFMFILDDKLKSTVNEFTTNADEDADVSVTDKKRLNIIKRDFKKFSKNRKVTKLIAEEIATIVA
jgi:hypothetical protein